MGEIKKIVVEHYPAERLPEDLLRAVGGGGHVRITVEREVASSPVERLPLAKFQGAGKGCYAEDEVVDAIRALREHPQPCPWSG